MRNGKLRGLLVALMLLVFLAGLASILYPYIWGAAVDSSIANTAKAFLDREEPELPTTTVIIDSIEPEKVKPYPELWEDMVRYNQSMLPRGNLDYPAPMTIRKPASVLRTTASRMKSSVS